MVGRNQGLLRGRLAIVAEYWGLSPSLDRGELVGVGWMGDLSPGTGRTQQGLDHLPSLSALALVFTGMQVCRGLSQWL